MNEIQLLSTQPELIIIRDKHNIEEERFVRGVIFAEYIVNGENATNAYMYAFECDKKLAQMNSSNLRNAKWVQDLIMYFRPDENTLYFGEIRQIIRKGMQIVDDPMSEPKDVVSAINALAKYIKVSKQTTDAESNVVSDAAQMIAGLMEGIGQIVEQNKMVDKHGNIIDVPILE